MKRVKRRGFLQGILGAPAALLAPKVAAPASAVAPVVAREFPPQSGFMSVIGLDVRWWYEIHTDSVRVTAVKLMDDNTLYQYGTAIGLEIGGSVEEARDMGLEDVLRHFGMKPL